MPDRLGALSTAAQRLRSVPWLRTLVRRLRWIGIRHRCSCCGSWLHRFVAHPSDLEMTYQSICPVCQCKPVHRRGALFLRELAGTDPKRGRILHIAPEGSIAAVLHASFVGDYTSCDIAPRKGQVQADIARLPFDDGQFGLLYCCHVLMLVPGEDLDAAVAECYRVMQPGGLAIIEHPVKQGPNLDLEYEPESVRAAQFYYPEILRLFGADEYWPMFEKAGFEVRRDAVFSAVQCARYALYERQQEYLVKPGSRG